VGVNVAGGEEWYSGADGKGGLICFWKLDFNAAEVIDSACRST